MGSERDFFEKITDETFQAVEGNNSSHIASPSKAYEFIHISGLKVYRTSVDGRNIDFPENWSWFSDFLSMSEEDELIVNIDEDTDYDRLRSILNIEGTYLAFHASGSEGILRGYDTDRKLEAEMFKQLPISNKRAA